MSLLDVLMVIVSAVVILYYLHEAEYAPEEIDTGDAFMIIWALLNLLKPYDKSYCFERLVNEDRIAIGATREVVEEVLKILKYREPDLYASIKAAALSTNGDFKPDYEALRECYTNGETHARHVSEVNEDQDPDSYEADREAEDDALYHELDEKG